MDTLNFIFKKKEEVYNDNTEFDNKKNKELIKNYDNLNQDEKDLFFLNNVRLVANEVKKLVIDNSAMYDEFMATGIIGLHKAIKTYNSERNVAFSSYASICIRNEIYMFLRKERRHKDIASLNYIIYENDNSGNDLTLEDTIMDEKIDTARDINIKILYEKVLELFPDLSERDAFILTKYFCIDDNKEYTLSEIANLLGYSQSYVSRCKDKALTKIKGKLKV